MFLRYSIIKIGGKNELIVFATAAKVLMTLAINYPVHLMVWVLTDRGMFLTVTLCHIVFKIPVTTNGSVAVMT